MIYKNVEIHNAAQLTNEADGGVSWYRIPTCVYDKLEIAKTAGGKGAATGVELRFVMHSDTVTLRLKAEYRDKILNTFHVYRGSIQGGWEDHEFDKYVGTENTDIVIKRSQNEEQLKQITKQFGYGFDSDVIRVIFDRGNYTLVDVIGDVEPPLPEQCPAKTLLSYGSSITHGSNSIDMSHSWVSVLAHNLNYDYLNLGFAGSCALEPALADYIADLGVQGKWDIATLELGVNVVHWEREHIRERVTYLLDAVAGKNPDKPIIAISPFYFEDDFRNYGRAHNWREIIPEVIQNGGYKNVTYVNGLDVIGDMSYISADETHPNIFGCQRIADYLTGVAKSIIK